MFKSGKLLLFAFFCAPHLSPGVSITTLSELETLLETNTATNVPFSIEGTIALDIVPEDFRVALVEGQSALDIRAGGEVTAGIKAGDRVRMTGFTMQRGVGNCMSACATNIVRLKRGQAPPVKAITAAEFLSGRFDARAVNLTGVIRDAQKDEIDPAYIYFTINCDNEILYAFSRIHDDEDVFKKFIGVKASIDGICIPYPAGSRLHTGRMLAIPGPKAFTVLQAAVNPDNLPELSRLDRLRPIEVAHQGRHRTTGTVLAAWGGENLILRKANGIIVGVKLAQGNLPYPGETIDVTGFPNSDLYRLNLSKATWSKSKSAAIVFRPVPIEISIDNILTDECNRSRINTKLHGQLVRFSGRLTKFLAQPSGSTILILECDKHLVSVNVDASPTAGTGFPEGCLLEVTGICVMDTDNWRPDIAFPRIRGFTVVIRSPDDLKMISQPPWWTTMRLISLIGLLILLLTGIFLWNLALHRRAERRGRELMEESIARAESAIKTLERTRLAVELHDSIAQSLTSVALEIMAAEHYKEGADRNLLKHLGNASKRLDSCRTDIRNCLWDLRNQALEDCDMTAAIRRTLIPHIGNTALHIRFNVPRERLTDNTTHDILCIIRELVLNAIRHGGADEIRIAGSLEKERLDFSVRDNGCGFDPSTAPGVDQGHFGLEGVRERTGRLGGDISIESSSRCTAVTVTLPLKTASTPQSTITQP